MNFFCIFKLLFSTITLNKKGYGYQQIIISNFRGSITSKLLLSILLVLFSLNIYAYNTDNHNKRTQLYGVVTSNENKEAVPSAVVFVGDGSKYAAITDSDGAYTLNLPSGEYKLSVNIMGFEPFEQMITIENQPIENNITITPSSININEVIVRGESNSAKVNKLSYNVQAMAIDDLRNTTANLTDVLSKANGVRIRESGGVGSDAKISLNGFSGSHVKIFVDGILQSGNSAFSLNNIPANYAERIEVYTGVVPIEFGSDALGGVINIVTKDKDKSGWNLDASYSYGSFNTHRSNITFTNRLDNGLQYKINAYQNYSDNNYKIDNTVTIFNGSASYTPTDIYTVERFNDTYHNEAIIGEIGFRDKSWADIINLSVNYAKFYREVQTGTRQKVVYGDRHNEGYSVIPTLQYMKKDFLTKGLSFKANANYNYGITHVVDTTVYAYNWFGDTQYKGSARSYTFRETTQNSFNTNANASYSISESQRIALNYTLNSTSRNTRSAESGTNYSDYAEPQYTTKGLTGLSYMYKFNDLFNAQLFGKHYMQSNDGVTYDTEGVRSERNETNGYFGYGAAGTIFFLDGFQAKLSYELAYRLPTTTELFGDSDLELGNVTLEPESSDNYNINLSYSKLFGKHNATLGGGVIYCDSKNFIRRVVSSDGESASSVNHGNVKTKGWNATFNYDYGRLFSVGANVNALNSRDNEPLDITTGYASTTYGQRMPNEPYLYANADGRINFYDVVSKDDHFYAAYDLFYQHEFPLYWEDYGDKDTKKYVPTQWSHNIALHYVIKGGKYNFSVECKNISNAMLYDNFSLQKAGRAFYGKVRINIGSNN
ncbi:MAG: TonB-dependent receptor [Rikenellaceae bacterium]